tara:strand:- start:5060 stop:5245 length:186 start_codon:yes stop_codon:yes gene_type:complete
MKTKPKIYPAADVSEILVTAYNLLDRWNSNNSLSKTRAADAAAMKRLETLANKLVEISDGQ